MSLNLPDELPFSDEKKREQQFTGKKQEKEYAELDKHEYIDIVNRDLGADQSPILDIIAWHIHRASYEIIQFNEEL